MAPPLFSSNLVARLLLQRWRQMARNDDTQRIILPAASPARRWPHLVVVEGNAVGLVFRLLRPETIIGRGPGADIQLPSETVSRRHASVSLMGGGLILQDLGSHNGTFVDMEQVREPRILKDGDHITVGDVTLLKLTYAVARDAAIRRAGFESASRDPETMVSNPLYFLDRMRAEHAYARRHLAPLTLVFMRVDGLADEAHGQDDATSPVEDAMRDVAAVVQQSVRAEDVVARAGHAEIVALLRSNEEQAIGMAERVRSLVAERSALAPPGRSPVTLTAAIISIGMTGAVAPETILVAAHESVREALKQGKDGVLVAASLRIGPGTGTSGDGEPQ
jgi:two-component system cell cycle response regulator